MAMVFIRLFFLFIMLGVGYFVGSLYQAENLGAMIAGVAGLFLVGLETAMKRVSVRGLSSMVFGLLLGIFMAKIVSDVISLLPLDEQIIYVSRVVLTLIFSYLGAVMALRGKDEFHIIIPYVRFKRQDAGERVVLLDTSAIIDGRILDIYKTRFFDDRLIVPRFVLQELQVLADSKDELKHERGRRGLDIVDQMQKNDLIDIRIHEDDFFEEKSVDAKLVRLARMMEARICTTDYNLGRVAQIQEVDTLNVHELAQAVRLRYAVGDKFSVFLVKEGKEPGQALAYSPDGTMIVVAQGKERIGETVQVVVTSLLQTQGGELVFVDIC